MQYRAEAQINGKKKWRSSPTGRWKTLNPRPAQRWAGRQLILWERDGWPEEGKAKPKQSRAGSRAARQPRRISAESRYRLDSFCFRIRTSPIGADFPRERFAHADLGVEVGDGQGD